MRTPLQKNEKILLITHTSWVTLVPTFLVLIVALIIAYFIDFFGWGLVVSLPVLGYAVFRFFSWKVNIWVVTDSRVIDESGLLSHFAKESPLEKINNVSYSQHILGRILNYGNVEIQTAAEVGATNYYNVHEPKKLKDTITLAQADYKSLQLNVQALHMANAMKLSGSATSHAGVSKISIAEELEKLHELRQRGILSEEEYQRAKFKLLNG